MAPRSHTDTPAHRRRGILQAAGATGAVVLRTSIAWVGEDVIRCVPKELQRELVLGGPRIPGSRNSAPPGP
jgi:hypothetical protein